MTWRLLVVAKQPLRDRCDVIRQPYSNMLRDRPSSMWFVAFIILVLWGGIMKSHFGPLLTSLSDWINITTEVVPLFVAGLVGDVWRRRQNPLA